MIALAPAPEAPAGSADPTRRWALEFPDGAVRFAGVARTEAQAVIGDLERLAPADWDAALIEVSLPVVLAEGAGPYLLDADGRVTLALGAHPALPDHLVAMGEPRPAHRIGLVRRAAGRLWRWEVSAEVAPADRVEALSRLDAAAGMDEARRWRQQVPPGGRLG